MELTFSPTDFAKEKVLSVQEYSLLAWRSIANLFGHPRYLADTLQQADLIGFGSLPIVLAACFFTGAALALNSASSLSRFGAISVIGQLVSVGIVRELGPVLAGLVVAGRNASGMASELGSMVVTEQIDAMRALGTDPTKKLVTPRVISTIIMLFFLTILGDLMGLIGEALSPACSSAWTTMPIGAVRGKRLCSPTCLWDWRNRWYSGSSLPRSDAISGSPPRVAPKAWDVLRRNPWSPR